jgi:MOSC domain-containing protein YiiM
MHPSVVAVSSSPAHEFSKSPAQRINLLVGLGVEGDAHCGATVKHRSRLNQNPLPPNLRQVHLIHCELFEELAAKGLSVAPGQMGENITTRGIALLALPVGAELQIGPTAIVRITGLRNPCGQLDRFQAGLKAAVLERAPDGHIARKAGVMGVVVAGGLVSPGDAIAVSLPSGLHRPLECV